MKKEKFKPRIPLRYLMWTVLPPNKTKDTIWETIDYSKIKFDIDFIEKEFSAAKKQQKI